MRVGARFEAGWEWGLCHVDHENGRHQTGHDTWSSSVTKTNNEVYFETVRNQPISTNTFVLVVIPDSFREHRFTFGF
jgi:hypothetical protein